MQDEIYDLRDDLEDERIKRIIVEETLDSVEVELQEVNMTVHECYLEHTKPSDTEVNDRRKFMKLLK